MSARILTILNTVGCLALTGLLTAQWLKQRDLTKEVSDIARERDTAYTEIQKLTDRRASLEQDIATLKESLTATQQAAETAAKALTTQSETATQLQNDLNAARAQVANWETALKERDTRITTLQAELTKTRALLDEAIAKLKQAGAR